MRVPRKVEREAKRTTALVKLEYSKTVLSVGYVPMDGKRVPMTGKTKA
jgi:hypothetical protein